MDASLATHHHHRQRQHTPNTSRQKPKLAWMRKGIVLPGHFPYVPLRHPGAPLRRHYPTCRLLTHQQASDSAESDNQRRRANHTLISEPTTTSATPIQNACPTSRPIGACWKQWRTAASHTNRSQAFPYCHVACHTPSTRSRQQSTRHMRAAKYSRRCQALQLANRRPKRNG